jgi:hypothetical protein
MKKKETTSDYGDFSIPIPLYCNKNSLCVIEFAPSESQFSRNCIRISNLNVDTGFAFDEICETENISLKQFKPADIAVGLYLTKEEKKSKGRATFISELEGVGPLFDVNMFINESLFNRLFSSIENSGNDFLFQLKFFPFLLVSDLKNISEFNTASSGKGCNITDYKIEFSTNNY